MQLMSAINSLMQRDFYLAIRERRELFNPLLFFIIVVSLFPLAITPDTKFLREIAPGVIWVAALLATLLSLDRLFKSDYEDGSLEQLLLSPHPLPALVLGKVITHWLTTSLPLIIVAPLLGMMLHLSKIEIETLMLSLLLGTPVLSLLGAIGSALTVGLRGGGILLSLIILPLYIPVLIFASSSIVAAASGLPIAGYMAILGCFLLLAFIFTPFATAAALRIGQS